MSNSAAVDAGYFERLFASDEDPWAFKSRWYEVRKRALTLACLPAARYASAYEPGCANGEFSAALADRCDALLVSDGNDKAVEIARRRLAAAPHVTVERGWVPEDWPSASFDLIVLSELGYYLDARSLPALASKARESLRAGGTVVACHWRARIDGCLLGGDAVHAVLDAQLGLLHSTRFADADMVIDVWGIDGTSVAQREGLRPQGSAGVGPPERPSDPCDAGAG